MLARGGVLVTALIAIATARPAAAEAPDPVLGGADDVDGDEASGVVAFTFDDGPHLPTTEAVVDALVAYDVPAAFFVVGNRLAGKRGQPRRDLLAKIARLGFEIGNHSHSHPNLAITDKAKVDGEIDKASALIEQVTGKPVGLFRPPFGAHGTRSRTVTSRAGLTTVMWSVDSLDWRKPKADKMIKSVVDEIFAEDGGVVLFHDTKKLTAKTIATVLDEVEARNCARLAAGEAPIVPVSIHYFLRDGDKPRPIPPEVEARTARYREALPGRCAARTGGPDTP